MHPTSFLKPGEKFQNGDKSCEKQPRRKSAAVPAKSSPGAHGAPELNTRNKGLLGRDTVNNSPHFRMMSTPRTSDHLCTAVVQTLCQISLSLHHSLPRGLPEAPASSSAALS